MRKMEEPAFLCQCRLVPESNEGLLEKVTTINGLSTAGTMRGLGFISIREEICAVLLKFVEFRCIGGCVNVLKL